MTKIRRVGAAVDIRTARMRALEAAYISQKPLPMSAFARCIWPDANFRSPQGAAFAASPIVRKLHDEGMLKLDGFYYCLTLEGRIAVRRLRDSEAEK